MGKLHFTIDQQLVRDLTKILRYHGWCAFKKLEDTHNNGQSVDVDLSQETLEHIWIMETWCNMIINLQNVPRGSNYSRLILHFLLSENNPRMILILLGPDNIVYSLIVTIKIVTLRANTKLTTNENMENNNIPS